MGRELEREGGCVSTNQNKLSCASKQLQNGFLKQETVRMKESKSAALLLQDLPFFSFNPSSMGFFYEKRKKKSSERAPPSSSSSPVCF